MKPRHAPWTEGGRFAIGLRPIAPEAWLEGGEPQPWRRKDPLLATHPADVFAELDGSRPAQAEVLDLVAAAAPEPPPPGRDLPPLQDAARRVADDLCLMEARDGGWRLTALSLCAGSFFTAREVIGRDLAALHAAVPGFDPRLLSRVTRIFDNLRPGMILERRNWTVVNDASLFAPDAAAIRSRLPAVGPADAGATLFLRVERQTLRRLPRTGAALFTIRVWLDPLNSLLQAPEDLAAFARAWKAAEPDFARYKRFDLTAPLVEAFLSRAGHPKPPWGQAPGDCP